MNDLYERSLWTIKMRFWGIKRNITKAVFTAIVKNLYFHEFFEAYIVYTYIYMIRIEVCHLYPFWALFFSLSIPLKKPCQLFLNSAFRFFAFVVLYHRGKFFFVCKWSVYFIFKCFTIMEIISSNLVRFFLLVLICDDYF